MTNRQKKNHAADLLSRVESIVGKNGRRKLLVALSGGSDSVALLDVLTRCRNIEVFAVHCNFHLRGEESMRDERFCRELCSRLGVELNVVDFDVAEYRKLYGGSVEMACRELRYDYFRCMMKEKGCDRIVTGHNADDNAETLFLNLMRGSGIKGLSAMREDTGEILRPLLHTTREEITLYLQWRGLPHVEDSTNSGTDYSRNFIRNEVLPLLRKRWPGATASICKTIDVLNSEQDLIDNYLSDIIAKESVYLWEEIGRYGSVMSVLMRIIGQYGGTSAMAREMAREIEKHTDNGIIYGSRLSGKTWIGNDGVEFRFERDGLYVINAAEYHESELWQDCFAVEEIEMTPERWQEMISKADNRKLYLPCDVKGYCFRHPQRGDRIAPLGMKGTRLVSDIMSDAKLTSVERQSQWLVTDSEENIIWVAGLKRSRLHLLQKADTHALRITLVK